MNTSSHPRGEAMTLRHGCFESPAVEQMRRERNTDLIMAHTINMRTGIEQERLVIGTVKVDPKKRGKAIPIFATYCPFCGEKLPDSTGDKV